MMGNKRPAQETFTNHKSTLDYSVSAGMGCVHGAELRRHGRHGDGYDGKRNTERGTEERTRSEARRSAHGAKYEGAHTERSTKERTRSEASPSIRVDFIVSEAPEEDTERGTPGHAVW